MSTLVLGLGGTGGLVARRLKALLDSRSAVEVLVIDQDLDWMSMRAPFGLGEMRRQEVLPLSGETSRTLLRHLAGWQPYLAWLPSEVESLGFEEWAAGEGAGGRRWLGRVAFFAHDQVIREGLRASIASLSQRTGTVDNVILVAALEGGTGSGLLIDVTFLVASLLPAAARWGCLLLSTRSRCGLGPEQANAYASLAEVVELQSRGLRFQAIYPMIESVSAETAALEAWRRVFVFDGRRSAEQPYFDAVERMALALAIQIRPLVADVLRRADRRPVHIRDDRDADPEGFDDCLNACLVARESRSAVATVTTDWRSEVVAETLSGEVAAPVGVAPVGPQPQSPSDDQDHLPPTWQRAAAEAADRLIDAVEAHCREIAERGTHEAGQVLLEHELRITELAVAALVERPELPMAGQGGFFRRAWRARRRLFGRPKEPRVTMTNRDMIPDLPGFDRAIEVLTELLPPGRELVEGGAATTPPALEPSQLAAMLQEQGRDEKPLGALLDDWHAMLDKDGRNWLTLHSLERRCAALVGIAGHSTFRRILRERLTRMVARPAPHGTERRSWMPPAATPPADVGASGAPAAESADPVAVAEPAATLASAEAPAAAAAPALATVLPRSWQSRIDAVVAQLDHGLFMPVRASRRKRSVPLALVPEGMLREVGEATVVEAMMQALRSAPIGPLCDPCYVVPVPEDQISILLWDLNHSPCELRGYAALRSSYEEQPARERFHIDPRFLAAAAEDPCRRAAVGSVVGCGNTGCGQDLAALPAWVHCCPGCCQPIRSRCGNEACRAADLHRRSDGRARSCPDCRGFNHAAWWLCRQHGNVGVWVSIDKRSCPECIRRHQEDEERFPFETISWRPHDRDLRNCPNCVRLAETDQQRKIFVLPQDLVRFYDNGVNGHDLEELTAIAGRYGMPEGGRCPRCRAPLIPADQVE